ncbi:MAG: hypothetical protein C4326_00600 [Ignavibacteria bacterium]
MNKLIFQIGILGFCISAVVFGSSGATLLEIVSRSFLVFVGIVLAFVVVLIVSSAMIENNEKHQQPKNDADVKPPTTAQQHQ